MFSLKGIQNDTTNVFRIEHDLYQLFLIVKKLFTENDGKHRKGGGLLLALYRTQAVLKGTQ